MVDFLIGQHGNALFFDILWQSGLFLMVGLVASVALRRRPARAHRVLLLAILGAVVTPLCSQLVRREGWGLWSATVSIFAGSADRLKPGLPPWNPVVSAGVPPSGGFRSRSQDRLKPGLQPEDRSGLGASQPVEGWTEPQEFSRSRAAASIPLRRLLMDLWGVLSGLCLVRLIVSMIGGRQIVSRARRIADGSLVNDAAAASTHLGLHLSPDLLASDRAACPAIWCWGRRPVILLPETGGVSPVDWVGVFCHELAHWVRRDHVSSLIAEVLTCLLPWHPLAWWAKHRLSQLSELACDDWAIASGREPVAYAETLLNLVPRRRMTTAMAAVSRRGGLVGRVAHIIATEGTVEPRPGRRWSVVVALVAVALVPIIALAQRARAMPESMR